MAKRVSIQQAAANALRAWLTTALRDTDADTVIPAAVKTSVATSLTPITYSGAALDGSLGASVGHANTDPAGAKATIARRVTVTTTSSLATYSTDPIVVTGKRRGHVVTENLVLTTEDGGETLATTHFFDAITSLALPEQQTIDGAFTFGVTDVENVEVYDRWPEPTVPLRRAVSILLSGAPDDALFDPVLVSQTTDGDGVTTFVHRFRCRRQNLQLDVWGQYDVDRDDIVARLDQALNASQSDTVAEANADIVRNGLLLALGDGWTGNADYYFEGPSVQDSPDSDQQSEFRATYRGHVDVMLTSSRTAPLITEIQVKQKAHEAVTAPPMLSTDIVTIDVDDSGVVTATFTQEP